MSASDVFYFKRTNNGLFIGRIDMKRQRPSCLQPIHFPCGKTEKDLSSCGTKHGVTKHRYNAHSNIALNRNASLIPQRGQSVPKANSAL